MIKTFRPFDPKLAMARKKDLRKQWSRLLKSNTPDLIHFLASKAKNFKYEVKEYHEVLPIVLTPNVRKFWANDWTCEEIKDIPFGMSFENYLLSLGGTPKWPLYLVLVEENPELSIQAYQCRRDWC